jgi:hypothetical protein
MNLFHGRIDVHHHLIPPAFVGAMASRGIGEVAGARLPVWTPRSSLEVMDANGIGTAVVSLSAPGVHFGGGVDQARGLARECNEFAAQMVHDYPGRFGSFAVLPMPFTQAACAEAPYALDTLKADGIVLLGSTDGKFLGDPSFEELMAELDRRGAVVFVHPNIHASSTTLGLDIPGFGTWAPQLEFEITEGTAMVLAPIVKDRFRRLRARGVAFSVDDFGTGYSNLATLQEFEAEVLKIDKRFIDGLPKDQKNATLVKAMIQMAQAFGMEVVAEGVETAPQYDFLASLGCHQIQGYFTSRPISAADAAVFRFVG